MAPKKVAKKKAGGPKKKKKKAAKQPPVSAYEASVVQCGNQPVAQAGPAAALAREVLFIIFDRVFVSLAPRGTARAYSNSRRSVRERLAANKAVVVIETRCGAAGLRKARELQLHVELEFGRETECEPGSRVSCAAPASAIQRAPSVPRTTPRRSGQPEVLRAVRGHVPRPRRRGDAV